MQSAIITNEAGKLLASREALLSWGVYTDTSYRSLKSRNQFSEVSCGGGKYVLLETLPERSRKSAISIIQKSNAGLAQLLLESTSMGIDCTPIAVEATAETLEINEPFVRAAIETYMNTQYTLYVGAYMDAGINSNSIKGYAKQCALIQWIYDYTKKISTCEASTNRTALLMRSFRANLLTALGNIQLEIKIPLSAARFNKWLDDVIDKMTGGQQPHEIIQVKRLGNSNGTKITPDQFNVAYLWYINGTNMSVRAVYEKWMKYAKDKGWWINKDGEFNPPTEGRLYQLLQPVKNKAMLEKTDAIAYHLNLTPNVSRDLPTKKNHVWVIDGTAHNENVEHKGKVKQYVYAIKVADVATMRLVGASTVIGVKEPFNAVKDAVLMGIRTTGYKPAILQCDRGPAWRELEVWCNENDIKLYPSMPGNARAKTIESLFNMFDNDITRYLKGYSGQNRTALDVRSRASEKRENAGKRNARSASIAETWIKTEGIKAWNERIIKTLEGKKCNKTPYQLWDEKESFVPKLDYVSLCKMCGTRHDRKLTINGLDISHNKADYTYFPSIETPEEREYAAKIFNSIPLAAQTLNVLAIYILEGGEPAPVFDHSGKFIGIWNQKPRVGYIDKTGNLDKFMALIYRVKEQAKSYNQAVKDDIAKRPDAEAIEALGNEMLTGKRVKYEGFDEAAKRFCGRYDKSELLTDEVEAKAGELITLEATPEYIERVDPDTGEVYRIKTN
jgi:hypothetical protein